ncbi:hypothetical protein U1Q18_012731, partial [Sarracenia purpurea var. burkii]
STIALVSLIDAYGFAAIALHRSSPLVSPPSCPDALPPPSSRPLRPAPCLYRPRSVFVGEVRFLSQARPLAIRFLRLLVSAFSDFATSWIEEKEEAKAKLMKDFDLPL